MPLRPLPSPESRRWPRLGTAGLTLALLLLLTFLIGSRLRTVPPHPLQPSPPAREAYLRGIYFYRHEQYENAAAALMEAVLRDPGFAPAYATLAQARLQIPEPPETDLGVTEAAARRALALDPDLADAHLALGDILLYHYRDWAGAGQELRTALALVDIFGRGH